VKQHDLVLEEIDELASALLSKRMDSMLIKRLLSFGDGIDQYKRENCHSFFSG
jgi:hypothetical protein